MFLRASEMSELDHRRWSVSVDAFPKGPFWIPPRPLPLGFGIMPLFINRWVIFLRNDNLFRFIWNIFSLGLLLMFCMEWRTRSSLWSSMAHKVLHLILLHQSKEYLSWYRWNRWLKMRCQVFHPKITIILLVILGADLCIDLSFYWLINGCRK